MRRVGSIVLIATFLGVAGCGGGADEGSAEAWADDLCGSLNGWVADVDEALEGLTDEGLQLDRADVDEAVESVGDATDELGNELDELGAPETESGQQAREVVTDLRATLSDDVEAVESALSGDTPPLEAVSTVAEALASAADALQESYAQLVELDPGGQLESALQDAEGCEALRDQLADVGG
jgi:septation ring formation regulator EzrA